jgi:spermidine synthase
MTDRSVRILLLISVFAVATSGLVYELLSSTLASYLLGDSVTQFSTVIGVYLFAMGIGSYLSKFLHRNLTGLFVQIELLIGLIGGCSAALLFLLFNHVDSFRVILYSLILVIGTLVGIEIPLLLRILKDQLEFKDLVSKVFTFDYIGALFASLLFPLLLVPHLGLVRTSFLFGILNVAVAVLAIVLLKNSIPYLRWLRGASALISALLIAGFVYSDKIVTWAEAETYPEDVVFATSSSYQRIVLTRNDDELRLYLNGNLQFSSRDEYRYHEALVHPGLGRYKTARHILVLGGGDGFAIREILKYPQVESVNLVELDPAMTTLFSSNSILTKLNQNSLHSSKVRIVNEDAFTWLKKNTRKYDFAVIDFPDPTNFSLGKLYTTAFYQRLRTAISEEGACVIQCTSPLVARKAFWCINTTLENSFPFTAPYHAYVPSFGEWGFILASAKPLPKEIELISGTKFLSETILPAMFEFPPDMAPLKTEINRLNNQMLVRYFEEEWGKYSAH